MKISEMFINTQEQLEHAEKMIAQLRHHKEVIGTKVVDLQKKAGAQPIEKENDTYIMNGTRYAPAWSFESRYYISGYTAIARTEANEPIIAKLETLSRRLDEIEGLLHKAYQEKNEVQKRHWDAQRQVDNIKARNEKAARYKAWNPAIKKK